MAVISGLDRSTANALRLRRSTSERDPAGKLRLLRRLQRQHVRRDLPFKESHLEQSFNEQVFAAVLGYQTLFSHDRVPFHLLPKHYANGNYSDFTLGFFGDGADITIASAELKGPEGDLDAPQTGAHKGITAVQQAFAAARAHGACRWVLVSNFRELRVYSIANDAAPIATAYFDTIVSRDDLAAFCAHFDRDALLGRDGKEPDLAAALDPSHPRAPVSRKDGDLTVSFRFVPAFERQTPLYILERTFRDAIDALSQGNSAAPTRLFFQDQNYGLGLFVPLELRDGWLVSRSAAPIDGNMTKVAVSRFGEAEVAVSIPMRTAKRVQIGSHMLEFPAAFLGNLLEFFVRTPAGSRLAAEGITRWGHFAGELIGANGLRYQSDHPVSGRAQDAIGTLATIEVGDFAWTPRETAWTDPLAEAICEIAAHFRGENGGVAVSHEGMATALTQYRRLP